MAKNPNATAEQRENTSAFEWEGEALFRTLERALPVTWMGGEIHFCRSFLGTDL